MQTTPLIYTLPVETLIWGGIGLLYSKISKVSPSLSIATLAISQVADTFFFLLATVPFKKNQDIKIIYSITNLSINGLTLCAMVKLNLMGQKGSIALACFTLLHFLSRFAEAKNCHFGFKRKGTKLQSRERII